MPYTTTDYNGKTYSVPDTGADEDATIFDTIPDEDHARAFLMQDGNLRVPGGRYGSDTADCMEITLLVARIMEDGTGEPTTYYSLNFDMGLVVNGSDDVGMMLVRDAHVLGDDYDVTDWLDDDEIDAARAYEALCYGESD